MFVPNLIKIGWEMAEKIFWEKKSKTGINIGLTEIFASNHEGSSLTARKISICQKSPVAYMPSTLAFCGHLASNRNVRRFYVGLNGRAMLKKIHPILLK